MAGPWEGEAGRRCEHGGSVHLLRTISERGQVCVHISVHLYVCVHVRGSHTPPRTPVSQAHGRRLRVEWVPGVSAPLPGPRLPRRSLWLLSAPSWHRLLSP